MKTLIALISSICLLTFNGLSFETPSQHIDKIIETVSVEQKIPLDPVVSDSTFIRRVYLDLVGRIPTHEEYQTFLKSGETRRHDLTVHLLKSESHVQHLYHFWADLLRLRDTGLNDNVGYLRGITYIEWIKEQIRQNTSYDQIVHQLLTAEGDIWTNPASGYYLRDFGMPLDNFSNTSQIFMGVDLSCAQCHDDPFQDWKQLDFYNLASFVKNTDTKLSLLPKEEREVVSLFQKQIREKQDEISKLIREGKTSPVDRGRLNQMGNFANVSFQYALAIDPTNVLKLPHDYKYDDAEPNSPVEPKFVFGETPDDSPMDTRVAFADWLIHKKHPTFTRNIVNRLWDHLMGKPLVDNMNNIFADSVGANKPLLDYLEILFKELNYDIKRLQYHIVNTKAYSRIAYEDDSGFKYIGQSSVARRLTAPQLWDSYLVLKLGDIDSFVAPDWRIYGVGSLQISDLNFDTIDKRLQAIYELDTTYFSSASKDKNLILVRASYINSENQMRPNMDLLKKLGFSDRSLVNDSNEEGSVAQVLLFANGPILDLVFSKDSYFMENISNKDEVDYIWESFLQRKPTMYEKTTASKLTKEDIVWALLNSQEFRFTP